MTSDDADRLRARLMQLRADTLSRLAETPEGRPLDLGYLAILGNVGTALAALRDRCPDGGEVGSDPGLG